MAKKEAIAAPTPRLLNVESAAHYLGATTWSVRKLAWDKEVPHVRIGQRLLFDIKDLDKFIEQAKA